MGAILKLCLLFGSDQTQPRFVNQCRGLQGVAGRLLGHLVGGESAQFLVNGEEQLLCARRVSLLNRVEYLRHLAHMEILRSDRRMSNSVCRCRPYCEVRRKNLCPTVVGTVTEIRLALVTAD